MKKTTFLNVIILVCVVASIWLNPVQAAPLRVDVLGTDNFGYQVTEGLLTDAGRTFDWVDARSGGSEVTLTGGLAEGYAVDVPIGFAFPFYEQFGGYDSLNIYVNGFITFTLFDTDSYELDLPLPNDVLPNHMIAPLWENLQINDVQGEDYGIFVKQGPENSYFAIEWYHVYFQRTGSSEELWMDFEVVLYPNGDVVMAYETMQDTANILTATVGIEDEDGVDGLMYPASSVIEDRYVRFTRPALGTHVKLLPPYQSTFLSGGQAEFYLTVRNISASSAPLTDTFSFQKSTLAGWTVSLFKDDGVTPLVTTSPVNRGDQVNIIARVTAPGGAAVGTTGTFTLTAVSQNDATRTAHSVLQVTVPTAFAQASYSNASSQMKLSLTNANPPLLHTISNLRFSEGLSITQTTLGFYAYSFAYLNASLYSRVQVQLVYPQSGVSRSPVLMPQPGSDYDDKFVNLSPAPNGDVGVVFSRERIDDTTGAANSNVYFAIVNPIGAIKFGPLNVTNNSSYPTGTGLSFVQPRITALTNGNYVLMWIRVHGSPVNKDVEMAIYSPTGQLVRALERLTDSSGTNKIYDDVSLAKLGNGRYLAAYTATSGTGSSLLTYRVHNSNGGWFMDSSLSGTNAEGIDSVQLAQNGNVALTWIDRSTRQVSYAMLNADGAEVKAAAAFTAPHPRVFKNVSITYDQAGNGVVTFVEDNDDGRTDMYYALINNSGGVLSAPLVFMCDEPTAGFVVSAQGEGTAPYKLLEPGMIFLPTLFR